MKTNPRWILNPKKLPNEPTVNYRIGEPKKKVEIVSMYSDKNLKRQGFNPVGRFSRKKKV